jgi:flagellar biosynthesis regulator FlaF
MYGNICFEVYFIYYQYSYSEFLSKNFLLAVERIQKLEDRLYILKNTEKKNKAEKMNRVEILKCTYVILLDL